MTEIQSYWFGCLSC